MPRYIDADRFKMWLQKNYVLYDGDRYFNDIDAQPTADVVEVKHGRWKKMLHSYFKQELPCCSVCGHFSAMRWKYCPNCGARMDGKETANEKD